MEEKEKQYEILELLARHEQAIGSFYEVCAETFPELEEFWRGIAAEEKVHALWIKNLKPKIEKNLVYLNTTSFTEQSIGNSLEYLEEEKLKVQNGEYDKGMALATALDIESALIDSKTLDLFSTDSAESKHFLNFLVEETEIHIKTIKDKIELEKA